MADLDMKVFIGMSRVMKSITRESDKLFGTFDLTRGQFAVLEVLYHKGAMSIGRVADRILTTSGNIPVIIRNLEKRELLTKHRDEYDKRKWNLKLTGAGRELVSRVYPLNEEIIKRHMAMFSADEQRMMVNCFKRIGGTTLTWNDQLRRR